MTFIFDLPDSEYVNFSYSAEQKKLQFFFKLWNEKTVQVVFDNAIAFCFLSISDPIGIRMSKLDSSFLNDVLRMEYEKIPDNHGYSCYEILNQDEEAYIKIVAQNIKLIEEYY
jgi:hypothetical protein